MQSATSRMEEDDDEERDNDENKDPERNGMKKNILKF